MSIDTRKQYLIVKSSIRKRSLMLTYWTKVYALCSILHLCSALPAGIKIARARREWHRGQFLGYATLPPFADHRNYADAQIPMIPGFKFVASGGCPNERALRTTYTVGLVKCAAMCQAATACDLFVYNEPDSRCQLRAKPCRDLYTRLPDAIYGKIHTEPGDAIIANADDDGRRSFVDALGQRNYSRRKKVEDLQTNIAPNDGGALGTQDGFHYSSNDAIQTEIDGSNDPRRIVELMQHSGFQVQQGYPH